MKQNKKLVFPFKALMLAGGSGTRLWPLSRQSRPKQILSLYNRRSLLDLTYKRIRKIFDIQDIWLATSIAQAELMKSELPEIKNFSFEPEAKNTAPAVGLAVLKIWLDDPKSIIATVNSDHFIKDENEYRRLLKVAAKHAYSNPDKILLIGVKTEYPETGYGYIETGKILSDESGDIISEVKRFVEKPDLPAAEKYHKHCDFFWNPAIFVFSAKGMLNLFSKHLPEHYEILMQIKKHIKDEKKVAELFSSMEAVSIDCGIMEKDIDLIMIAGSFGWSDIGSFRSVHKVFGDQQNSFIQGLHVGIDSTGNLIYSDGERMTATIGVHDSVIINTKDVVLVAPLNRSQEVKDIVTAIQDKKQNKYL